MTGGRYCCVNQNVLALVEGLIFIWPVIALALLINRSWLRKAHWVTRLAVPSTTFSLTNYQTSKFTFHTTHLHIHHSFFFYNLPSDNIKYEDITCIEVCMTEGMGDAFQILYDINLHTADTKITTGLLGYTTVERVLIIKTLKNRCPNAKFNKRAKMFLRGYFLLRKQLRV